MQRIDVIIHELNHSGVANAAVTLANGLIDGGKDTRLVVVGEEKTVPFSIHAGLEIRFLNVKKKQGLIGKLVYLIKASCAVLKYLRTEKSQNVFVWAKEFSSLVTLLNMLFNLKLSVIAVNVNIIEPHLQTKKIYIRFLLRNFYRLFLPRIKHIISQSAGMRQELENIFGINRADITVVYPPLQKKFFAKKVTKGKTGKILFIGRLSYQKNPAVAIEVFSKLTNNNFQLLFVGEGELEAELRELAEQLGVINKISFLGRQDDVLPFLHEADALILTSRYEGFGMVLAESIAVGTPVVSFNCQSGPSEIIIDGENGYLVENGNIEDFVTKLNLVLNQEWDTKKITETANKFHPDVVIGQYVDVIEKNFS